MYIVRPIHPLSSYTCAVGSTRFLMAFIILNKTGQLLTCGRLSGVYVLCFMLMQLYHYFTTPMTMFAVAIAYRLSLSMIWLLSIDC